MILTDRNFGLALKRSLNMVFKTEGIIIKKADLVRGDRLITVYSKDFGKIILKNKTG